MADLALQILLSVQDKANTVVKSLGQALKLLSPAILDLAASNLQAADGAAKLASALDSSSGQIEKVAADAKSATETFQGMAGSLRGDRIITNEEAARAKIQLLESDANKLRADLAKLEHAADAGKAVDGIEDLQAKLLLAEKKAQDARDNLKKLESQSQNLGSTTWATGLKTSLSWSNIEQASVRMAQVVGPILLRIGQGAVAVAEHSAQSAADFQQAMISVGANAGATQKDLDSATQSILRMSGEVGQSPKQLADSLYYVAGAGYNVRDSLIIMEASARTAQVGLTDSKNIANGLTSALSALGLDASNTKRVLDEMQVSVSVGKTEWEDYSKIVGKLALNARNSKVSFEEATSAFSILTNSMPSSRDAANSLASLLQTSSKFDLLENRAKALGLSFDTTKYQSMSLLDRMRYLQQVTGGNSEEIGKLLGQQNAQRAMTLLLTGGAKSYSDALDKVKHASDGAGAAADAWNKTQASTKQQLDQAKASLDSLSIQLGAALLPGLNAILKAVGPLIQHIVEWEQKNHGIENSLKAVGQGLVNVVGWIINFGKFLRDNQPAMVAFAILMGTILVAALVAVAVAAWSAAVPFLALTWPILLVGAIIAAVVAGIIWAVQNWGSIVKWLQGVWSGIVGFFQMIWNGILAGLRAIGQFFVNIWNGIVSALQTAWNFIVNAIKAYLTLLWNIFTAPFRAIAALFQWLYNHNIYFQMLVNRIRAIVAAGIVWLQMAWRTVIGWITGAWQGLVNIASNVWSAVSGAVRAGVEFIVNWLRDRWNGAINDLGQKWSTFKDAMGKAWAAVSGVITGAWQTYIAGPIGGLLKRFLDWAGGLKDKALQWGANMLQGFINGILSKLGDLKNMLGDAASNIAHFLGFHSPTKEGPGAEADEWPKGLIRVFTEGLKAGQPELDATLNTMFSPLAMAYRTNTVVPISSQPAGSQSRGGGDTHIHLTVNGLMSKDKREFVDFVDEQLAKRYRRGNNAVTQSSGGRTK